MLFDQLPAIVPDPILGSSALFRADRSPHKVDLGIGVYRDEAGRAAVLESVKRAEQWLVTHQGSKSYLSSAGEPRFNAAVEQLLWGESCLAGVAGRVRTIQTPGGSGALRVVGEFIRRCKERATVWIPNPTWTNHIQIMRVAGLEIRHYPYYDRASGRLRYEAMISEFASVRSGEVVLLHGCCHNPAGADLDAAQWREVLELLCERDAVPLIDIAYQGFAHGFDEDAVGVRIGGSMLPEMLVVMSCYKNFALYRDRVGALSILTDDSSRAERAYDHVLATIRALYSMPPDHGAAVVAHILNTPELRTMWSHELAAMRTRIQSIRAQFAEKLQQRSAGSFAHVAQQSGMFALLEISAAQIERLRSEFHVYTALSGRINVAAMSGANVGYVANAIASVLDVRSLR
jgi:aspartate aminotransferase